MSTAVLRSLPLIVPVMLLSLGGSAMAAEADEASAGFVPTATPGACPPLGLLEVEGETVECGTVTVPVDYQQPNGDTYDLAYVLHKARSQAA